MQDFRCSECGCEGEFESAAALLLHFSMHVSQTLRQSINDKGRQTTLKKIPDLYPINRRAKTDCKDADLECDSGIEDVVNPLKYCMVTMNEKGKEKPRKYLCTYCSKRFGWPTDLKRHILIHTGERPFHCQSCDSSFTRNFLLKKHQRKCHDNEDGTSINKSSRKQEKSKIKHRTSKSQ